MSMSALSGDKEMGSSLTCSVPTASHTPRDIEKHESAYFVPQLHPLSFILPDLLHPLSCTEDEQKTGHHRDRLAQH